MDDRRGLRAVLAKLTAGTVLALGIGLFGHGVQVSDFKSSDGTLVAIFFASAVLISTAVYWFLHPYLSRLPRIAIGAVIWIAILSYLRDGLADREQARRRPPLPSIVVVALPYLVPATDGGELSGEAWIRKQYEIGIRNDSKESFFDFSISVRFPDAIKSFEVIDEVSAPLRIKADSGKFAIGGAGSFKAKMMTRSFPIDLSIAPFTLPPDLPIRIRVETDPSDPIGQSYRQMLTHYAEGIARGTGRPYLIPYYIAGSYRYERSGSETQLFDSELTYDENSREIAALSPVPGRRLLETARSPGNFSVSVGGAPGSGSIWGTVPR